MTETKDDSIKNYITDLIELQPGEEKFLGREKIEKPEDKSELKIDSLETMSIEIFQPTDQQLKEIKIKKKTQTDKEKKVSLNGIDPEVLAEAVKNEFDTIINGRQMMYRYVHKAKAVPVHKFQYLFEITGQIHLKEK